MAVPWPRNFPLVFSSRLVEEMQEHPSFEAAKKGSVLAAENLVADLANPEIAMRLGNNFPGSVLLAVRSSGGNAIPEAYVNWLASISGLKTVNSIAKKNGGAKHTAKDAYYRFANRVGFELIDPLPARTYIIVDDVCTQGGTISELRQFIYANGGRVLGVATLAHTDSTVMSNGRLVAPSEATIAAVEAKFGLAPVGQTLAELGIYDGEALAMTESECRLLLRANSLGEFASAVRSSKTRPARVLR